MPILRARDLTSRGSAWGTKVTGRDPRYVKAVPNLSVAEHCFPEVSESLKQSFH